MEDTLKREPLALPTALIMTRFSDLHTALVTECERVVLTYPTGRFGK